MEKKIVVMLTFIFLLFEVIYFNSNRVAQKVSEAEHDVAYRIETDTETEKIIREKYQNDILREEQNLYILCNDETINEIENNYHVLITE